jgi:membrane protein DedA with SNARE-associated domain
MFPAIRTFISLPAGIARMDVKKFALYSTLGSFPWCLTLAYIGSLLGSHWSEIEGLFRHLDIVVIAGAVGLIVYLFYHRKLIVARMRNQ